MAKKPEEPIDHLSEKIVLGRLCEEVQRKNVFDENNDQQEKLMMLVDFINENAEAAFVIQYKNYGFNKVYNEDLAKDDYVGMARVSNKALLMEFILKLIKNKKGGTIEECTKAFFRRLLTDGQYREDFRDEHHMLEQHITKRAQQQNGTVEAECDDEAKAKNDQEEFREDEKD
ncbi:unnamed protein product [Rotaria socialis]|uniref:Uncharacterized protein n=1 Tax=Rotaria socialis TaxID=392032 RepID=A0A818N4W8_9BILA|nr:unnamed protein product [Rotaria socialis]